MSTRVCIPIHNRRFNWCSSSQLINWYCTTWYLLRSSTFPLCTINGSSICNYRRLCAVIPVIYRSYYKPKMTKGPIYRYVRRSKPNILPTTLPGISWYATTILRLPRCIYYLKYHFINRVNNFFCKSNNKDNSTNKSQAPEDGCTNIRNMLSIK
jgi:hypothetical protein